MSNLTTQKLICRKIDWGSAHLHAARLNSKTCRVGIYKCFTLLSEIERKFFAPVGILEKGDSDVL